MNRKKASPKHKPTGIAFFEGRTYLGRPPSGAGVAPGDIILRKSCFFLEKGSETYPVPQLLLLATKKGFRWLSRLFAEWAKFKNPDEDVHDHVGWPMAPIDCRHSDEMEIRVGMITPKNKHRLFKKFGITSSNSYRGDLRSQYKAQMRQVEATSKWLRRIERILLLLKKHVSPETEWEVLSRKVLPPMLIEGRFTMVAPIA